MKLKFGTGKFFGIRSPKITLRIHKNKPVFSYFTFQVPVILDWKWDWKLCGTTIIPKKFFLQKLKTLI